MGGGEVRGWELFELPFSSGIRKRHTSDSKRVYHLSNLSVALKCLRENGVELVSNNVTDLADGNPYSWLGLIWQMILHFQVSWTRAGKLLITAKPSTNVGLFFGQAFGVNTDNLIAALFP